MTVVVVGAGVVGASVAYHLAKAGLDVTVVDRAASPGAGVTAWSFGWVGGDPGGDWPGRAEEFRPHVIADHRRLAAEVPGYPIRWTGAITWGHAGEQGPRISRTRIGELEPHLRNPPAEAVHRPRDAGVDPAGMTTALVDAARRLGARVRLGVAVTAIAPGRVDTSDGRMRADTIVVAAGTGAAELADLPVAASPAMLTRASAPPGLVRTIVATPDFEVRETEPGRLLMTGSLDRVADAFGGAHVRMLDQGVGARPMPEGGPIVGFVDDGIYAAVMHSGVTLAPTVGRLVAQELADTNG